MQRFFALIALLLIIAGGVYYYQVSKKGQDPEAVINKALAIPGVDAARAYVENKVKNWEPDPEDPEIKIPKNWGKSELSNGGYTYVVYSPDQNVPPKYYASFAFPKPLIEKTPVIKCWGTAPEKDTDVCIVGTDATLEAYFKLFKFLKAPSFDKLTSQVNMASEK